jgi:ABC-type hemin transport system substrate-binding protein
MTIGVRDSGFGIRAVTLTVTVVVAICALTPSAGARQSPTRIVSLVPSATEMLFAMGAGPSVAVVRQR